MNTAYNNHTNVQESRNRYNALLAQALKHINRNKTDKTAQEPEEVTTATPEEVTTTATDVTTTATPTQQPEEVTTEYYGYLDKMDPMQKGRIKKQLDRRIYADGKMCTWAEYIAEGYEAGQLKAYKDEYTYDKKGRDLAYHEHKVTEWVIWTAREIERGNGVVANKTIVDYALYLIKLMETTAPEYTIALDDLVTAPAIEEATATAPQATEEDTTTAPEEVATEEATAPEYTEEEEKRKRREADYITVLKYCVEHYGEVGADYLDTLDYTQATEQVYTAKRGNSTKVTERFYSIDGRTIYGLHRRYSKNGKRAKFVVFKDGQIIEERTYGKNNNSYKAEVKRNDGSIRYQVEDGKVTRAEYLLTKKEIKPLSVEFDDSNRPETPRDLPAPAPSKTTKEASKQEDAPYWLLLDQELQAQQEEQAEEPDNEETDDPEEVERTEEVVFLKGAELDKVIAEYSERNNLDIEYQNKRYYFYATADGYIVKLDKNKPKSRLYIADEGPYYDSYRKGEITDRTIFFEQNMDILGDYSRQRLESPVNCNVRRTITGDLSIDPFGKIEYSYDPATGKSEEIPVKHPTPRELAVYVAARDAYEADQRARLEKYWKRYSDKVSVGTYWADR